MQLFRTLYVQRVLCYKCFIKNEHPLPRSITYYSIRVLSSCQLTCRTGGWTDGWGEKEGGKMRGGGRRDARGKQESGVKY